MDCSLSGSSVHGIFQARVLEWIAISFSRGSSQPRNWTQVSCIAGRCFTVWATKEVSYNCSEKIFAKTGNIFNSILTCLLDFSKYASCSNRLCKCILRSKGIKIKSNMGSHCTEKGLHTEKTDVPCMHPHHHTENWTYLVESGIQSQGWVRQAKQRWECLELWKNVMEPLYEIWVDVI